MDAMVLARQPSELGDVRTRAAPNWKTFQMLWGFSEGNEQAYSNSVTQGLYAQKHKRITGILLTLEWRLLYTRSPILAEPEEGR
jgi:hypothetical protein